MSKDCQNGGLRYREQSTVLGHISRLCKGRYLGLEMTFKKDAAKNIITLSFLFIQALFGFKRSPGRYFSTFLTLKTAKDQIRC